VPLMPLPLPLVQPPLVQPPLVQPLAPPSPMLHQPHPWLR